LEFQQEDENWKSDKKSVLNFFSFGAWKSFRPIPIFVNKLLHSGKLFEWFLFSLCAVLTRKRNTVDRCSSLQNIIKNNPL
jgi:hypothetical protein